MDNDSDSDSDSDSDDDESGYPNTRKRHRELLAVSLLLLEDLTGGPARGPKRRQRMAFEWDEHVQRLNEKEFKARYRLHLASFNDLLQVLRADLETDEEMSALARPGQTTPVTPEVRLATTLRYLAGGMVLDLKLIYCISKSQCYDSIWKTVDAINSHLSPPDPLSPEGCWGDANKLATIERDFRGES